MMTIVPVEGTPFWNWPGNYTPPQHPQLAATDYLSAPATGDAATIAKNYLQQNGSALGVTAADISRALITNQYTDPSTGITHVYFQQSFNGLPIADAHANVSIAAGGRVIAANASFVGGLAHPATNTAPTPTITVPQALDVFASAAYLTNDGLENVNQNAGDPSQQTTVTDPELSVNPIIARLQYIPSPTGSVDLGWQIIAQPPGMPHWFDVAVGASGSRAGQVTRVADWVNNASYTVLAQPIQDPLFGTQSVVVDPQDALASPFGWHDTNFLPGPDTTTTSGNNVIVTVGTTGGPTVQSLNLNFNFAFDPTQGPVPNTAAQVTNLFYWVNLAHNITYHYGFDEAGGNFQTANRSGVGIPSDPVRAIDQFQFTPTIPLLNNAFMATPPDGQSPTMAIGVSTLAVGQPLRSLSFDNGTTMHEFFHGVSNRLTGGPANANALQNLQSGGLGEGWSDWFELITTMKPGDTANTPRPSSLWFAGQQLGGTGIRRFPYSFDMSINPLTLGRYNGDQFPQQNNSEVHNSGEIWASALWDMTWLLINKYGLSTDLYNGKGGNNVALQLVHAGLKLQPVNPDFLEARDAIIAADLALNGGANYELIWQAFARRGFGTTANTPGSNSLFVTESFSTPSPLGHVRGTVFNDVDGDARRDAGEPSLAGITVYHDANNNARLDTGERQVTTQADGSYDIAFVTSQLVYLRQALTTDYRQSLPSNNGARVVFVTSGETTTGVDFGNQAAPGKIAGIKFNDLNANGIYDTGEPGIPRTVIYVDLNNDGKISIVEPSSMTDNYGRYTISGVQPGSNYVLREVLAPGAVQTVPGPLALLAFAHSGVVVLPNQTVSGLHFGNTTAEDFGDAPDTYGTTLAGNGPRHGVLPGLHLGALIDVEVDGQPTADATGDDTNPLAPTPPPVPAPPSPDDEDGVVFVGGGITPGAVGTIQVTASTATHSPARLQGWIDFDQDGRFESNERIVANMLLSAGTRNVSFLVPSTALNGSTFARFRYAYESDLGPTGPAVAGEVEDYQVNILPGTPVANPDVFPLAGAPLIKTSSVNYPLDVLRNDPNTIFGPPRIVPGSFPAVLTATGSTLMLNAAGDRILYTAGPRVEAGVAESFTYQVTDGRSVSAPGQVTINISLADPIALDNTFTLPASDAAGVTAQLAVMLNDLFPQPDTVIVGDPVFIPQSANDTQQTTLNVDGTNQRLLNFSALVGFRGTEVYRYTIDDTDDTTAPASALVTIQVVDPSPSDGQLRAAGYQAVLTAVLLDPVSGQPANSIAVDQGDTFRVRVTARDLRTGGTDANRGVQAAYLDLLFDRSKVAPVLDANDPSGLGFAITFDPVYNDVRKGQPNRPGPGQINEAGATSTANSPPGIGDTTVFTVLMRAIAPTSGQLVNILGNPADVDQLNDVVISAEEPGNPDPNLGSPVVLADNEVFLQASGDVIIFGAGEGEFVNRVNPFDVNVDASVSPVDALTVINSLNSGGSRSLRGAVGGFTSSTAVAAMVDVNMDSMLSPIDALMVVNFINSFGGAGGGAEGEGEGAASSAGGANSGSEASLLGLLALDVGAEDAAEMPERDAALLDSESSFLAGQSPAAPAGSTPSTLSAETTDKATVDAAAADDLFADLAGSRTELNKRFRRR